MKVKELIEKLEEFDEDEEIKLRIRYVKGKEEVFFDFTVEENTWSKNKPFVNIESKNDIDRFLIDKHGCEWLWNYY